MSLDALTDNPLIRRAYKEINEARQALEDVEAARAAGRLSTPEQANGVRTQGNGNGRGVGRLARDAFTRQALGANNPWGSAQGFGPSWLSGGLPWAAWNAPPWVNPASLAQSLPLQSTSAEASPLAYARLEGLLTGFLSQIQQMLDNINLAQPDQVATLESLITRALAQAQAASDDNDSPDPAGPATGSPSTPPSPNLVNRYLDKLLQRGVNAQGQLEEDPDTDGLAVSQADLDNLREALESGELPAATLANALQSRLLSAPAEALDEMAALAGVLVDRRMLPVQPFLQEDFLRQANPNARFALSEALANSGLRHQDGQANRALASWLLQNLEASDNALTQGFSRQLVSSLANVWQGDYQSPEGRAVLRFLRDWVGVQGRPQSDPRFVDFLPDSQQPFPLNIRPLETATASNAG